MFYLLERCNTIDWSECKQVAENLLNIPLCEFHIYSKRVAIHSKKRNNVRFDGCALRKYILGKYQGNVYDWVSQQVYTNTKVRVPSKFVELFMPLPCDAPVPYKYITLVWTQIKDYIQHPSISDEHLSKFIKTLDRSDCVLELFIQHHGSQSQCATMCRSLFTKYIKALLENTDDTRFDRSVCERAYKVRNYIVKLISDPDDLDWVSESKAEMCVDFIMNDKPSYTFEEIEDIIESDARSALRKMALSSGLVDVIDNLLCNTNMSLSHVAENIHEYILFNRLVDEFDVHGMDVLDDNIVWNGSVCELFDRKTELYTSQIFDLIGRSHNHSRFGDRLKLDDCDWLREVFDRYYELQEALKASDLEIRDDSKLCQEYVETGTYNGPTEGLSNHLTDLEKVVRMMHEMHYLYTNTAYGSYMRVCGRVGSEEVKKAILFGSQNIPKDLPPRLANIASNVSPDVLKTAYDKVIKMKNYYEEIEYHNDFDSDSSDDY